MATIQRFNPPPGWPTPPSGWRPGPGWAPDPSWGPVPEGWRLWVSEQANPKAWSWSLLSALGLTVVLSVIGMTLSGGGPSAEAIGEIFGRELMAGVITGFIAWRTRTRWNFWVFPGVVLGISLLISVVSMAGRTT